jgi:hypothetical protein
LLKISWKTLSTAVIATHAVAWLTIHAKQSENIAAVDLLDSRVEHCFFRDVYFPSPQSGLGLLKLLEVCCYA